MKRRRYDPVKVPLININVAIQEVTKRLKSMPDPLTSKQEKRKLIKAQKDILALCKRIQTDMRDHIKLEEEFQRTMLEELKKEHINVRPTQGKPLQTVVWSKGRKTKPAKAPPKKSKK